MIRDGKGVMHVKEWMTPSPVTVSADTPAEEARERMRNHAIRHVLVTKGDALIGVLSQRDPGAYRAGGAPAVPPSGATVGDFMTRAVFAIGAEAHVAAAADLMRRHRIGALPVFDRGRIVGILTRSDLLGALMSALTATSSSRRSGAAPADHATPVAAPCHDLEPGYAALAEGNQEGL